MVRSIFDFFKPTLPKLLFGLEWVGWVLLTVARGTVLTPHELLVASVALLLLYLLGCALVAWSKRSERLADGRRLTLLIVLLVVDRMPLQPRYVEVMDYPPSLAFKIGLCQCLAMVPGVSRSGATIVGALLMGTDKRSAAEFSFFLAMPTMAGAFAYDLYKNRDVLSLDDATTIVVGFIAAFIAAVIVVRYVLDFISSHGFALFAWWRIIVGTAGLIGLWLVG